jgi:hypothetical protein
MTAINSLDDVDVEGWRAELEALLGRTRDCFSTEIGWIQAHEYVMGLVSDLERKNGWTLAERAQDSGPQKMQRLLNLYSWNAGGVRDIVRSHVVENLREPDGVLVRGPGEFGICSFREGSRHRAWLARSEPSKVRKRSIRRHLS